MIRISRRSLTNFIALCLLVPAMFFLLTVADNAVFAEDVTLDISSAEFYTTSTLGTPTAVGLKAAESNPAQLISFALLPFLLLATLIAITPIKLVRARPPHRNAATRPQKTQIATTLETGKGDETRDESKMTGFQPK